MPGLSGFNLASLIREAEGHEKTPIIFITSEGTLDSMPAATDFRAYDFITIPLDEAILREKVAMQLRGYMIRRDIRAH